MTRQREKISEHPPGVGPETLGLIWFKCAHPAAVPAELEAALRTAGYDVHCGQEAPERHVPSTILFRPSDEDDVCAEVSGLRGLFKEAFILILCVGVEAQFVLTALRAGARGFVGIQPAQVLRALRTNSMGSVIVSRRLLEAFLDEKASREDCLAPHQREILLNLAVTASMTFGGELVLPKELFEAFLGEIMIRE